MSKRKYTYFRMDGSTQIADRRDMINEFQTNPKIFAFLLSTRAGGLGVNLTGADTVIFYDIDWNPTMDARATDRVHRIGQTKEVSVYRLITANTIEERVVKTKRISKTTKGGRRMRFSVLVIVGDKECKVGYGIGKATEVPNAIKKAVKNARKSIVRIPMTKKHTVYHEIIGHKGATKVLIKPAHEGTGIIAGGVIRDVLELAGFHDVYTKNLGSNTALNMVIAVVDGLRKQLIPHKVKEARDILPKKEKEATAKNKEAVENGTK